MILGSLACALFLPFQGVAQPGPGAFVGGQPLDLPSNARTFGSFRHAESIIYDPVRDVYVALNQGAASSVLENDGYVSLINPDGTVHTLKWIGVNRNGLTLNDPRGSHIVDGVLYVADNDHVRMFSMESGQPTGAVQVPGATLLNDLQVTSDRTIYVTHTGTTAPDSWRLYKISSAGEATVLVEGAPLNRPNGAHLDSAGNIVVVNLGDNAVLTFSPGGDLVRTERTLDSLNDGLVITPDGTKYISSLSTGTIARIRPGHEADAIAYGVPTAASMGYDPVRNRLVIPQNAQNAVTIVELERVAAMTVPAPPAPPATSGPPIPPTERPFIAGTPLALSPNARTFGSFRHAESVIYDSDRDLYLAVNQGFPNTQIENDGYVSLINPDGTVHTLKWIGATRDGLTLNDPRGSYIRNGVLYIADNTYVRTFDMVTGAPRHSILVEGSSLLNDLQVAADGTIYVTDTGGGTNPDSWRIYRISADGVSAVLVQGAPLNRPNGMHFDLDGNITVVNMGNTAVLTFSPSGELLRTEQTAHTQNDGLIVTEDGTKYVSSLAANAVTRIRPGGAPEVIAEGIPTPASIAYDATRNRLVIPQNANNAVTFLELGEEP